MGFFSPFMLRCFLLSLCIMSALASQLFDGIELILLLGQTGSGKSSFINLASGSKLQIGPGLKSCTSDVQFSEPFIMDGRTIVLVDTPGFDDSSKSDADNFIKIKDSLAKLYEGGKMLTGIAYIHRISDYKIGGIAKKNFDMFCKMWGNSTYPNVVLVTNMWGEVRQEVGEAREHELKTDDGFFATVLREGATLRQHNNTIESAQAILRHMLSNQPVLTTIQRETVDLKLPLKDTEAGDIIYREVKEEMAGREQDNAKWEARREQEKTEWEASREQDNAKWEEDKAKWEARREQDEAKWKASREEDNAKSEETIRKMEESHKAVVRALEQARPRRCHRVNFLGIIKYERC